MNVKKIIPQGYCHGVLRALKIARDAVYENKNVYILGSIIHNKFIVKAFEDLGCITLDDSRLNRLELLDKIDSGCVIFTAHGVSPLVYEKALEKGLKIIDATCPDVLSIHKKYKNHLNMGYTCLYIGKRNHPEVEGVLGISKDIILIESIDDLLNLSGDKFYISNQTTLSEDDVKFIYDKALSTLPNVIIDNERCNATTARQNALKNNDSDLCIIIGDKKSSNTKKLFEVSSKYVKTIMIENVLEIDYNILLKVDNVSISAGASTPKEIINDCYNYLLQFDKNNPSTYENRSVSKIIL